MFEGLAGPRIRRLQVQSGLIGIAVLYRSTLSLDLMRGRKR
jgi:hypothetical protein